MGDLRSRLERSVHHAGRQFPLAARVARAARRRWRLLASFRRDRRAARRTAVLAEQSRYDVLCFPIIDWTFRFQRPQQLMRRYAAAGHRVFYLDLQTRSTGAPYLLTERERNLWTVSLSGPPLEVYRGALAPEAIEALLASLDALRRDLALGATAAVVQLPFWWPLARQARDRWNWRLTYDCMDDHGGFSTNTDTMVGEEDRIFHEADLVVVSSALLEARARARGAVPLVIRNACEYRHFARPGRPPGRRPVIGYYGAIADWFDADLVADLAERRPDWEFVLVGSTFTGDVARLGRLPNVALPGEKPYADVPDWLERFDVAIIPFRRVPLTEATNPVKAYEMLAAGKPIVAVPLPEVVALQPLVRVAADATGFEREIVAALAERDPAIVARRRAFARQNTWDHRFSQLSYAVQRTFPKVSIAIVAYNNLALTKGCLETLYRRTEWPNFEVIVVDNASVDATPRYLRDEAGKRFPNLRVLLNVHNAGFAQANNQALQIAAGDYLVLLNNDTVLVRGWLSALLKHLNRHRDIGLIGPVTNEIGNEAKIAVGYTHLDAMPVWAARYCREHDGEIFNIHVLAMFCVAMRRDVFEMVGPLDERFAIGMFEDDDYAQRMRHQGLRIVCARDAFVHHEGRSSFKLLGEPQYLSVFEKNRRLYEAKWGPWEPHVSLSLKGRVPELCERLRGIVAAAGADRVVVMLPSIGWNTPLVQRPHHLAAELARQGYLVLFDCTGSLIDHIADFTLVSERLYLYKGPQGVLDTLENPIVWALPYNAHLVDRWSTRTVVYDLIDDLSVFPYRQSFLRANHDRMLETADVVFYVARRLREELGGRRHGAHYLPNAVEYSRFAAPAADELLDPRFHQLLQEGKPIVGYYGALASWLDVGLLAAVADARRDWSFVLIGHALSDVPSLRPLTRLANVAVLPAQPYPKLPAYLSRFTAAMIPFVLNPITEATSPLKLFEYFAGGKPVISAAMPECAAFEEVLIARTAEEFSAALDVAARRSGDALFQERLRAIARRNSWPLRARTIVQELRRLRPVPAVAAELSAADAR
jgi:GT2 family glycosyltransferase